MNKKSLDELLDEARALYEQDRNEEAKVLAEHILKRAETEQNLIAKAHALNTIGTSFFNRNLLEEALENYLAAEKILSMLGEEKQTIPSLINIAIIYNRQHLFELAIKTYHKALQFLGKDAFTMSHAQIHNGLGNVYSESGDFENAFTHFATVLHISQLLEIPFGKALGLSNMACVAIKLGRAEQAIDLARQTLAIAEQENYQALGLTAKTVLADAALLNGNPDEAIYEYLNLIPQIEAAHRDDVLEDIYRNLTKVYAASRDFEAAFHASEELRKISLRIASVERAKVLNAMQVRYETEKKDKALQTLQLKQERTERRIAEAELQSLRSRMNPHFVYNVMNTIRSLLHLVKNDEAMIALERFAKLNRLTLEHSGVNEVTVEQEIELLTHYIEIEKLLMNERFEYEIIADEQIEQNFTFMPSLLVQPFVENAIKHGLMHKPANRKLLVRFSLCDSALRVIVADNGIGRVAAEKLNASITHKPKSFATAALNTRLQLLNEMRAKPIVIETKDSGGVEQGTTVSISIPLH